MRFWDSSGIVVLLAAQPLTGHALELLRVDGDMIVWWSTPVECWSALMRLEREQRLTSVDIDLASQRLATLAAAWHEVAPVEEVRLQAKRVLRRHALRAADAVQLAAALVWSGPADEREFVTFDARLKAAARIEGLRV